MGYTDLLTYYQLSFALEHHHGWSGEFIENMYPFERDIRVGLLNAFLEKLEAEK